MWIRLLHYIQNWSVPVLLNWRPAVQWSFSQWWVFSGLPIRRISTSCPNRTVWLPTPPRWRAMSWVKINCRKIINVIYSCNLDFQGNSCLMVIRGRQGPKSDYDIFSQFGLHCWQADSSHIHLTLLGQSRYVQNISLRLIHTRCSGLGFPRWTVSMQR